MKKDTKTLIHLECFAAAQQDKQSITKDWESLQPLIEGVSIKKICNILKDNGYLVELYRKEWDNQEDVQHVFQTVLYPNKLSAWHLHLHTTDRLFVSSGLAKIVLYDNRDNSPTKGLINEFRFGESRPGLVIIPPGIWHGVMNIGRKTSIIMNLTNKAYEYEEPDHWRLPSDTTKIPYKFL